MSQNHHPFSAAAGESTPAQAPAALLDRRAVAGILKICLRTLHSETQEGRIRSVRLGRLVRYDPRDVSAYIEALKVGGAEQSPASETERRRAGGTRA